eukprot:1160377-Pelagomonas_calceolata.AAC.10
MALSCVHAQAVRANVNRAAGVLEEVLNDILQELLVDQAASYLTEERPELNEMEVRGGIDRNRKSYINRPRQQASSVKKEVGGCQGVVPVLRELSCIGPCWARVGCMSGMPTQSCCMCGCTSGMPSMSGLRPRCMCGCMSGMPSMSGLRSRCMCGCMSGMPTQSQ